MQEMKVFGGLETGCKYFSEEHIWKQPNKKFIVFWRNTVFCFNDSDLSENFVQFRKDERYSY